MKKIFILVLNLLMIVSCGHIMQDKNMNSTQDKIVNQFNKIEKIPLALNFNKNEYLSLSLEQNQNVLEIKNLLESEHHLVLKDRGEAHITIFSPQDYKFVSQWLKPQDIEKKYKSIQWNISCVGRGEKSEANQNTAMSTYFIVVNSPDLVAFRNELVKMALEKSHTQYNFDVYSPHITVGFTHRDLHSQDGVDKAICWKYKK